MIQAIFFDLGDTLVHISPAVLTKICEKLSKTSGVYLSTNDYLDAFLGEWNNRAKNENPAKVKDIKENAEESERKYWGNFFESLLPALGISARHSDIIGWLIDVYTTPESFECFDDVEPVLSELKGKGMVLGIISNAFPSADKILDHLGLKQHFKYLFLSFELPYAKPEIEIYKFSAEKVGFPIENILFVDDRWKFVKGAQDAKMNALLIEREMGPHKEIRTRSLVRRIKSLKELLDIVELSQDNSQPANKQKGYTSDSMNDDQNFCWFPNNSAAQLSMLNR